MEPVSKNAQKRRVKAEIAALKKAEKKKDYISEHTWCLLQIRDGCKRMGEDDESKALTNIARKCAKIDRKSNN